MAALYGRAWGAVGCRLRTGVGALPKTADSRVDYAIGEEEDRAEAQSRGRLYGMGNWVRVAVWVCICNYEGQ